MTSRREFEQAREPYVRGTGGRRAGFVAGIGAVCKCPKLIKNMTDAVQQSTKNAKWDSGVFLNKSACSVELFIGSFGNSFILMQQTLPSTLVILGNIDGKILKT